MLSILKNVPAEYAELNEVINDMDKSFQALINRNKVETLMQHSARICDEAMQKAIDRQDESAANAIWIVRKFSDFINSYSLFWNTLWLHDYKSSWMNLQDAMDHLRMVRRFTADPEFMCTDKFDRQLKEMEKCYPYDVFMSANMIVKQQTCSVCGRNPVDPLCDHLPGHLYWGKYCYLIAGDMEIRDVALISDPIDKRHVIDVLDEGQTEEQKYNVLIEFTRDRTNPYLLLTYQEGEEETPLSAYGDIGRNDECPCGSGKKLKNCCLDKGYIMTPCIDIEITEYFGLHLKEAMERLRPAKA